MPPKAKMVHDDFDENEFETGNPLAKYFRIPGLHVSLPTGGAFLPEGSYTFAENGEVAVWPMRAGDELLLKSPDALMSGYAVEKMLESCVPSIRTPKLISTPDLDVLLLAIRAATYGDLMEIETRCPSCDRPNTFDCHLPTLLDSIKSIPPQNPVRLSNEVVVSVRPYNYSNATQVSLVAYEESRNFQSLENVEGEERTKRINLSYQKMSDLNTRMLADCIIQVAIPEKIVTDKDDILEFINNIPKMWVSQIEKKLEELNKMGMDKTIPVTCQYCKHEWKTEVEFNPSNFFGPAS